MDETVPTDSHLYSRAQPIFINETADDVEQTVGGTTTSDDLETKRSSVVVGVNPLSSQQARMQELKLLKLKGITRKKSLNLSPGDGLSDVNSFYTTQKTLKESIKKQQLESMEYLHRYQNNEVAARKWRAKSEKLNNITLSSPGTPSTSHDSPERRDSPEQNSNIDDNMLELPSLLSQESTSRLSIVESMSIKSESKSYSLKGDNQDQSDEDHADNIEKEQKLGDHKIEKEHPMGTKEEIDADREGMEFTSMIDSNREGPSPETSVEEIIIDESYCREVEQGISSAPKIEEINTIENNLLAIEPEISSEPKIEDTIMPEDIDLEVEDGESTEPKIEETIMPEDIDLEVEEGASTEPKVGSINPPSVSPTYSRKRPPKSKLVAGDRLRQSRRTRHPQPRFVNVISPSSSDRDRSVDSTGSRRLRGESKSRNMSDLSSQSSCDSPGPQQSKTRSSSTQSKNSRGSHSVRKLNSTESHNSIGSRSTTGKKSTRTLRRSVSKTSTVIEVPMYEDLLKKGIRKNSKRNISDSAMCLEKWEPKAHESLAGCERCVGFAAKKEISAYHTNGHHHRIMMTRGGCSKSCKLFPRNDSQCASRMCQRCFHDTHMLKLW